MLKMKSIFYFLYLFFLTLSCLLLAMERTEAATYNFYFNNTEQGPNSNASPSLTVRDGKKVVEATGNDTATYSSASTELAQEVQSTAEGPDKDPLIPNPLPPAPWGKADSPVETEKPEREENSNEYPAFEPTTQNPARVLPSRPKKLALDMTVPQLLSSLFSREGL